MPLITNNAARISFIAGELASKITFKVSLNRLTKTERDTLKAYIMTTFYDEQFTDAEFDAAWNEMIPLVHKRYATATAGSYDVTTTV